MSTVLISTICITLFLISWSDFKNRNFHWIFIPILIITITLYSLQKESAIEVLRLSTLNLIFLLLQYAFLSIWFSIKNRKWTQIFKTYLGIGDGLLFVSLSFLFSPVVFIIFSVGSLILSLLIFIILTPFNQLKKRTIPLAGFVSIITIFVLIAEWVFNVNITRNSEIIMYLNGI